ncbi:MULTISPECIES: DnaB-like helicase C-terminal domain-containing protein [unclassified Novosphingobium]|uniref:replicative DNA helicase n=1 Tax=unclassified Novosphingobium TaxID=2644732 RepID=UPI000D3F8DAC|nr:MULTISPECIES: DnaB-like helicase C-terminal domain-containing protein [unclassified Novosphingobium]PTR06421.1 replicative DNA helicase [Novosphingobium sp. GV055]PUA94840.1 replicative DNA helicase [Novosphingobium sp. GV061]PUB13765.1 replicative DNA helicase [Novosphingobium sp. GV079]PUB38463.1 replicative DNA helicase [Novosphingobium sp. GV027]
MSDTDSSVLINPEAEAALLGAILLDRRALERAADFMRAEDFGVPILGRMFAAIVHEASLGRTLSAVMMLSHFKQDPDLDTLGGPGFLARLTSDPTSMMIDPADTAKQLLDLAQRRRMRDGLLAAIEACTDLSHPTAEIAAMADAAVTAREDVAITEADAADCVASFMADLDRDVGGARSVIIPGADELLGELEPGSLTIVAGRPGMGKTGFAGSYARGAASHGQGVLFVSLEMSKEQLTGRMLADMLFDNEDRRVPYGVIQRRQLNRWERERVNEAALMLGRLPLTIADPGTLTVGRLDMLVRRHKRRLAAAGQGLDLVVVDYLQLLHPDTRGRSAYEATSEVSKRLKGLAKEHGVAVMALAQLSRTVEQRQDKRPQLSDLRDSGQIEQDADAVMFLLREEYYLNQAEPQNDPDAHQRWEDKLQRCRGVIEFILAKRRNGTTGTTRGRFFAPYQAVR